MRKIMFLALMLSAMAIGSVSANDGERRPAGAMFGFGNGGGFVAVNIGNPGPGRPGEYRGGCPECRDGKYHKGECRSCEKHAKKIRDCKKCKNGKRCDYHKGNHGRPHPGPGGHPHPGYGKPHRPGTPPPPPAPRRW